METRLRYYTPDEKGETREERYSNFGQPVPILSIPDDGLEYWAWYWELSNGLRRVSDGAVNPIPYSEFLAWAQVTGRIVWPSEFAILREMDGAFCRMTAQEIEDYYARKFPPKGK